MSDIPGVKPPELPSLVRIQDRLTFLYVERCVVNREDNAVTITDSRGTVHVPAAALGVLMLGPGSTMTYPAICLLAESRSTCVWVGERGVRYYCHGASLAQSTRLLEAQARLVSSERSRLKVARRMFAMRFPNEDTSGLTMQQLLGKEGTRVRRAYERESKRTGVPWSGRSYKSTDFDASDDINKALSAANTALYGVVHAVIVSLGCSPGLGFVHARNERSFVYDVADLYKVDITIPLAFDLVAAQVADIPTAARRGIRDRMTDGRFLERCVHDLRRLLLEPVAGGKSIVDGKGTGRDEAGVEVEAEAEVVDLAPRLWSGSRGIVPGGVNYSKDDRGSLHDDEMSTNGDDGSRGSFGSEEHVNGIDEDGGDALRPEFSDGVAISFGMDGEMGGDE